MKSKIIFLIVTLLVSSSAIYAQSLTVAGKVTDENYAPMAGATVVEKGTRNSTVSGKDGRYSLTVSPAAILEVSAMGYSKVEVKAGADVRLVPSTSAIEEVVVVGFGTQRKESVVGAITTVAPVELKQAGATNLSTALAGKVSGLAFTIASGRPGQDVADLYIRGVSTLDPALSHPLVLVDGVERDYADIDPEEIEHLSILKDASATAVYGVRGANGVILIITKRGREGKPEINVTYRFGMQQPTRLPTFLGSYQHALLRNEALRNDAIMNNTNMTTYKDRFSAEDLEHYRLGDSPYTHPDNNYVKDFLKEFTPLNELNLNVRGGTDRTKYFISMNALNDDGMYKEFSGMYPSNSYYKRINLRSNLDFDITKSTRLSVDLNGRLAQRQNNSGSDIDNNTLFETMFVTPPMAYPYILPNGSYGASTTDAQIDNLMSMLKDGGYTRVATSTVETNVKLSQNFDALTKGLSAYGSLSYDAAFESASKIWYVPPRFTYDPATDKYTPAVDEVVPSLIDQIDVSPLKGLTKGTYIETGINYNRKFGNHAVSGMLVYYQQKDWFSTPRDASGNIVGSRRNTSVAKLGYAARATYAFRDTYLVECNVGYNGSDRFPKAYRYAWFPAFSAGYVLTNEKYMESLKKTLSFAKIRGSYGKTGNDKIDKTVSGQYAFLSAYNLKNAAADQYWFGKDGAAGGINTLTEGNVGNNHITWEVDSKANVGVDLQLFNRVDMNIDLFRDLREDIYISRSTTPQTFGVGTAPENLGRVLSKGFEVEAAYNSNPNKKFVWFVRGMYSYSRNKRLFIDEVKPKYDYQRRTGTQVEQWFGYTVLRYYTPDDFQKAPDGSYLRNAAGRYMLNAGLAVPANPIQPGDFMYVDTNNDGVIDTFDTSPIGEAKVPHSVYNVSYGARYKNFDFSMMWQGAGGNSRMMTTSLWEPVRDRNCFQEIHLSRWTEERWRNGEEILYPRLSSNQNPHNLTDNTFFLKRGDYLRLKSFELGYTFNRKQLSFVGLQSMRIYVGGNNLFTWAKDIKNFDPELSSANGFFYPQMKIWNFGINVKF